MTVWLHADGTPPGDNTQSITVHKQTERCVCEADLLSHSDHSEDHNLVITPASEEEEPQSLEFWQWEKDKQKAGKRDSEFVWKCDWMKYVSMEMTVCHQGSTLVWVSAVEMLVIPEQGACLDWDETERKC